MINKNNRLKIIKNKDYPNIGRCVNCDARNLCGLISRFKCECDLSQHYINIKKERKQKLLKIQGETD